MDYLHPLIQFNLLTLELVSAWLSYLVSTIGRAPGFVASKFGGVVSWHSPDIVRCQIPARGVTSSNIDDGKEREQQNKKKQRKGRRDFFEAT